MGGEQLDLGGRTGLTDLAARPEAPVDTVVSIFTLCSVPDVDAVLRGVRRVLRDNGQFLFLEHVPDWPGARSSLDLIGSGVADDGPLRPQPRYTRGVRRAGFVLMDLERSRSRPWPCRCAAASPGGG